MRHDITLRTVIHGNSIGIFNFLPLTFSQQIVIITISENRSSCKSFSGVLFARLSFLKLLIMIYLGTDFLLKENFKQRFEMLANGKYDRKAVAMVRIHIWFIMHSQKL